MSMEMVSRHLEGGRLQKSGADSPLEVHCIQDKT